jgi:hypothetical protein
VILFLLFTNDVTICMEQDPGIHIASTWFGLETGFDTYDVCFVSEDMCVDCACMSKWKQ